MGEFNRLAPNVPEVVMRLLAQRAPTVTRDEVQESLLIRNGHFCGQKFTADGWTIIWFLEENQLKIYRPNGTLEIACSADAHRLPNLERRAQAA